MTHSQITRASLSIHMKKKEGSETIELVSFQSIRTEKVHGFDIRVEANGRCAISPSIFLMDEFALTFFENDTCEFPSSALNVLESILFRRRTLFAFHDGDGIIRWK